MQTVEMDWTGGKKGVLRLEPGDAYSADDVWPFVVPEPKPMAVSILDRGPAGAWAKRLVSAVPGARLDAGGAMEVRVSREQPAVPAASGDLQFVVGKETHPLNRVLAVSHPLVEGLTWEGLLVKPTAGVEVRPSDVVLLWMGAHPLVVLRPRAGGASLLCLFDPTEGNALRNGSLALLTHRFMTGIQEGLDVPMATNVLAGQELRIPEGELRMEALDGTEVEVSREGGRWPRVPGWGQVIREGVVVLDVGLANGEVEEGDFREARFRALPEEVVLEQRERHEEKDLLFPLWVALLGAVLLGSWKTGQEVKP
jgi:hypothetical protein